MKTGCAAFLAEGGHETYDDTCDLCHEVNSDAPEWN